MQPYNTNAVAIAQCKGILKTIPGMNRTQLLNTVKILGGKGHSRTRKAELKKVLAEMANQRLERLKAKQ